MLGSGDDDTSKGKIRHRGHHGEPGPEGPKGDAGEMGFNGLDGRPGSEVIQCYYFFI